MPVLIPRTRTINVRLSESEYLELERFCITSSSRSMSDLVRKTLQRFLHSANNTLDEMSNVSEKSALVMELELRLDKLSAEIADLRTSAQSNTLRPVQLSETNEVRSVVEQVEPVDQQQ
jgi:hypothetical protein